MRIVGGIWAGSRLLSPGGRVRPTAEVIRVTWMELLGDRLRGARVLDLFAGSGALGLEALSRGAERADFVENGSAALHALKANVAARRLRGSGTPRARILRLDAIPFVEGLAEDEYDIAFADPPYGSRKLDRVVAAWHGRRFSRVLGVEHAVGHAMLDGGETVTFGETAVTLWG